MWKWMGRIIEIEGIESVVHKGILAPASKAISGARATLAYPLAQEATHGYPHCYGRHVSILPLARLTKGSLDGIGEGYVTMSVGHEKICLVIFYTSHFFANDFLRNCFCAKQTPTQGK